jgi:hypothetical protein
MLNPSFERQPRDSVSECYCPKLTNDVDVFFSFFLEFDGGRSDFS